MSIVRNFNLYLNAGNGSAPYINVNQYDQGEQWVFTLYKEDGTKYTPSTGAIVGIKADNRGIINTGTVDADGRVVINETQQMTAAAGIAIFELLIDGDSHGTANFLVNVEQRPGENAIPSESDLSLIQEAVDAASEIEDLLGGQDVPTVITPIISDWLDENITNPSNPPIDTSLTVAGAAADAKKTGDEITDVKGALFEERSEEFTENFGSSLPQLAPYMATEKYGFKTKATLSQLRINTYMSLNHSVSIRFEIRDANNNVYGTITNAYTVAQSGDAIHVDITFNFQNGLSEGQYYLWMFSSAASTLSYGYNSGIFPSDEYIELTPDGGWNNGVNNENLTSYRMFLYAEISGVAELEVSKIDTVEVSYERVNRQVDYDYDSNVNGWSVPGTYWTRNDDGSVTVDYTGAGNTWASSATLFNETIVNLVTEFDIEIETGDYTIYVQGVNAGGSTVYYNALTSAEQGHITANIDIAYLSMYTSIDVTKPIKVLIANHVAPAKFTISNWVCYYDPYADITIMGDSLIDTFRNIQDNLIQSTPSAMLTSPNGSKYALSVSDNGTINVTAVIPSKTLFIGNSLLTGNGFGMNATDINHDYYHYVTGSITAKKPTATYSKMSGTGFESCETESAANTWMANTLLPNLSSDLDLVIVQLGDNVNTAAKVSAFRTNCANLLRYIRTHCPNARVAWVGEWYQTAEKQTIISDACSATGCVFVDISDLSARNNQSAIGTVIERTADTTITYAVDSYNIAEGAITLVFTVGSTQYTAVIPSYTSYVENSSTSLTVTSNYTVTTNAGVASHPSNIGMLKVANRICYILGITDSETDITA